MQLYQLLGDVVYSPDSGTECPPGIHSTFTPCS